MEDFYNYSKMKEEAEKQLNILLRHVNDRDVKDFVNVVFNFSSEVLVKRAENKDEALMKQGILQLASVSSLLAYHLIEAHKTNNMEKVQKIAELIINNLFQCLKFIV